MKNDNEHMVHIAKQVNILQDNVHLLDQKVAEELRDVNTMWEIFRFQNQMDMISRAIILLRSEIEDILNHQFSFLILTPSMLRAEIKQLEGQVKPLGYYIALADFTSAAQLHTDFIFDSGNLTILLHIPLLPFNAEKRKLIAFPQNLIKFDNKIKIFNANNVLVAMGKSDFAEISHTDLNKCLKFTKSYICPARPTYTFPTKNCLAEIIAHQSISTCSDLLQDYNDELFIGRHSPRQFAILDKNKLKWTLSCYNFTGEYWLDYPSIVVIPKLCTFKSSKASILPSLTHDLVSITENISIQGFPVTPIEIVQWDIHSIFYNLSNMTRIDIEAMKWNISDLQYGFEWSDLIPAMHWPFSMSILTPIGITITIVIICCCCRNKIIASLSSRMQSTNPIRRISSTISPSAPPSEPNMQANNEPLDPSVKYSNLLKLANRIEENLH
jgi:hypothetical protein